MAGEGGHSRGWTEERRHVGLNEQGSFFLISLGPMHGEESWLALHCWKNQSCLGCSQTVNRTSSLPRDTKRATPTVTHLSWPFLLLGDCSMQPPPHLPVPPHPAPAPGSPCLHPRSTGTQRNSVQTLCLDSGPLRGLLLNLYPCLPTTYRGGKHTGQREEAPIPTLGKPRLLSGTQFYHL